MVDIVSVIEKNPGIKFSEIMRKVGLKNGALSHYLRKLEENGSIKIERTPGTTRCYPLGMQIEEITLMKHLRKNSSYSIVTLLSENQNLSFQEIVIMSRISGSGVSTVLSKLLSDDIVEAKFDKRSKFYQIKKRDLVKKMIDRYDLSNAKNLLTSRKPVLTSLFLMLFGLSQRIIFEQPLDVLLLSRIPVF